MPEQLTLLLATSITKAMLNKFYEGMRDKLAKKAVNLLPEKNKEVRSMSHYSLHS